MATIKDVAKLANVSTATVSRVLNNNGYVNKDTKERVTRAIRQLDYRPNDIARSLFKGKSKMIALFVPDIMNPFFPELARAVEDITNKHNYTFVLCNTDDDLEKEITYLNALQQKSVDGFIIVSSNLKEDYLHNMNAPVVALDRIVSKQLSSVTVNNRESAREATNYLKAIGCKRIAHICGPDYAMNTLERLGGYLDIVKKEKWFLSSYVVSGEYNYEKTIAVTKELLTNHPEIDGIFAANDKMGVGVIKAAEALGVKIPEELAVVGFDGIAMGETTTPSLTTMEQPIYDIGAQAAKLLLEHIHDSNRSIEQVNLKTKLIERDSTRKRR
ncbi:MAG: LacI family DNA-binding transcriptional regulator [Bacillota bacterium]|uniref:LacI family DNA-binding transcriptional regulator n=1 Tax=Virgibacillus salarius TaxID=447199 RepID=A0A941DSK0_9BACI|nr:MULTISPECIES: LacI family DNA-binding transcriptional regulator [Bacillaceae]NAZ07344.1 substrate-binding domain-containing protein [Agaribacter marinus]MBR7794622.1 LacI family DNA-binding transcriptional regulator [Virgibacillus salarius]MCC2250914.1 LacI family transcriptional regulator [Virgibacillus sp. AGTR]MDY7044758.1 LacI family DNA-binding transcriptional regulator [Virgibacillus sp. M23]QRZ16364.1 LacI family DNA-binding transcriptional regulator [Virgibacillus sp. AGTR]